MSHASRVLAAETLKQHRRLFGRPLVVFSMMVWPVLQLATTYYTLRPVTTASAAAANWPLAADPDRLLAFLATGTLAYAFFFSLVQSAWHLSFERATGTLELLFLSPAGRLTLMIANGAGALLQNAWLLTCFTIAALTGFGALVVSAWWMYGVVFLALLIPAVAWGAFLNSLLVFSRDSAFLYTILDEPLWFVSAVRLPNFALPALVQIVGAVFPLTGSLVAVRGALLEGRTLTDLAPTLTALAGLSALLLAAAAGILRVGEARSQRTGKLSLA
ncbi:ABC transporter permease [Streptomyces sp. NPDC096176]|uniref:ABC transporter permease n=1 Tax=Streptomyces sp. NPDC096176 TaxID=3366079 RepID=UPI0038306EF0